MDVTSVPVEDPLWREFVLSHPEASPFHLPAWATLVADCYGFESFALMALDSAGEVLAGAPVVTVRSPFGRARWVSLPYSDCCPLLVRPGADEGDVIDALRTHVLGSPVAGLEVRAPLPAAQDLHAIEAGYDYLLPLPWDSADLHPSKGHRRNLNHAIRQGIRVEQGSSAKDVETFYRLHTLTRRRQGVPVQPHRFFDLIAERLLAGGHGFVATAKLDGEPLAAVLYLTHNGTLMAKYRASDPARQDTGAGFLVDWEIMAAAGEMGFHTLDFGRTDRDADGQRRYKSGWGATEQPLVYTLIASQAPQTERPHVGDLPRRIIRHSPLWVCRALGEVLYRWTA